jgi:hypothetical protein
MASKPTPRKPLTKYSKLAVFSEHKAPKTELMRLLEITQYRINYMRDKPHIGHHATLKRWGFSVKEISQLGIKV